MLTAHLYLAFELRNEWSYPSSHPIRLRCVDSDFVFFILYGCETWTLAAKDRYKFLCEDPQSIILGSKRKKVTGDEGIFITRFIIYSVY